MSEVKYLSLDKNELIIGTDISMQFKAGELTKAYR